MHELSIALSILDFAAEEAERRGGRVVAVHLRLGPLSGVVKEALLSAYELAREGTPLAAAALVVEEVPRRRLVSRLRRRADAALPGAVLPRLRRADARGPSAAASWKSSPWRSRHERNAPGAKSGSTS